MNHGRSHLQTDASLHDRSSQRHAAVGEGHYTGCRRIGDGRDGCKQRLDVLVKGRPARSSDVYRDELDQTEEQIEKDVARLQGYAEELLELGLELKSPLDGLVDFPTQIDGKPALLCWKLGEPAVLYWHDLESGFEGRQPLTANTCVDSPEIDDSHHDFGDSHS